MDEFIYPKYPYRIEFPVAVIDNSPGAYGAEHLIKVGIDIEATDPSNARDLFARAIEAVIKELKP